MGKPPNCGESNDNSEYIIKLEESEFDKLENITIYLVRHGDAMHNNMFNPKIIKKEKKLTKLTHRFIDSSLTPIGIAQAAYLGSKLREHIGYTNDVEVPNYLVSSYLTLKSKLVPSKLKSSVICASNGMLMLLSKMCPNLGHWLSDNYLYNS